MRSASQSIHLLAEISRAYNSASRSSRFPAECSHQANLTEPDQPFPGKTLPPSRPHRAEAAIPRQDTPAKRTSPSHVNHSPAKHSYQIDLSEPDQPLPGETLSLSRSHRDEPAINRRGNPANKIQQAMTATKQRQSLTQHMLSEPNSPPTGWILPRNTRSINNNTVNNRYSPHSKSPPERNRSGGLQQDIGSGRVTAPAMTAPDKTYLVSVVVSIALVICWYRSS